ncbi:MAG: DNA replication and repair protein RecF [Candidatus Kapabacteria bacterium]|nr:DNA replication and repair protein RecF [Candidatus Kapabacteria bacterium]
MIVDSLVLNSFRNHSQTRLKNLRNDVNIFVGNNGAGKTSILEAISLCALSKSFLEVPDASLVQQGANTFSATLYCSTDLQTPYTVSISYELGARKKISNSYADSVLPKDLIGIIPLVIMSPDYKTLTAGTPSSKRSFLDTILSQSSRVYASTSLTVKKILKHRNALLQQARDGMGFNRDIFEIVTEDFIKHSAQLCNFRQKFLKEFLPYIQKYYSLIAQNPEEISFQFSASGYESGSETIEREFRNSLKHIEKQELQRGVTLLGPQKEDIDFLLNNRNVKDSASQGQHKTLYSSIKFAEFLYLETLLQEKPLLLFDDIFAEIDDSRSFNIFSLVNDCKCQTFVTSTDSARIRQSIESNVSWAIFSVSDGNVQSNYV